MDEHETVHRACHLREGHLPACSVDGHGGGRDRRPCAAGRANPDPVLGRYVLACAVEERRQGSRCRDAVVSPTLDDVSGQEDRLPLGDQVQGEQVAGVAQRVGPLPQAGRRLTRAAELPAS